MILKTNALGPKIAKNFYLKELMNSSDGNYVLYPDPSLGPKMQKLRDILGSMTITSGTRTKAFNTKVGGASNSFHLQGLAIDFKANFSGWNKMTLVKVFVACGFTNMKFYYRKVNGIWTLHRCHIDIGKPWNGKAFCVLANKYE